MRRHTETLSLHKEGMKILKRAGRGRGWGGGGGKTIFDKRRGEARTGGGNLEKRDDMDYFFSPKIHAKNLECFLLVCIL